jgi:hypothetical protein
MNEVPTRYGLDGPEIEFRWEARFSALVQTGSRTNPASYTVGTGSFPGINRPCCGVDHTLPSSAEVKERVELYLYSPSGPLWAVVGWNLPLPFTVSEHCPGKIKQHTRTTDLSQCRAVWLNLGLGDDRCRSADIMTQPRNLTTCICFWWWTWVALTVTVFP